MLSLYIAKTCLAGSLVKVDVSAPVVLVGGPVSQAADCIGVLSEGQSMLLLSLSVLTLPLSSILLFWF